MKNEDEIRARIELLKTKMATAKKKSFIPILGGAEDALCWVLDEVDESYSLQGDLDDEAGLTPTPAISKPEPVHTQDVVDALIEQQGLTPSHGSAVEKNVAYMVQIAMAGMLDLAQELGFDIVRRADA